MFKPKAYFERVWQITPAFLKEHNLKAVLLDVDNTLTAHDAPDPEGAALDWLETMRQAGVKLMIVSNNTPERVKPFADRLGVDFVTGTKPSKTVYTAALEKLGLPKEQVCAVGDQIFTDVWGANRSKIFSILTKPLYKDTDGFIRFKRILEKPFLPQ